MRKRRYRLMRADGTIVLSPVPGRYAGWRRGKIFGRLTCASGMRMHPENRVFFATWEDAVANGYRPCKKCRPTPDDRYERRGVVWHLKTETG